MFDEEIKIINKWQVVFYLQRGVEPIRVQLGFNDRLVFVYRKEDTTEVWQEWKKYTIERKLQTLQWCNNGACDFEDDDYFFNE